VRTLDVLARSGERARADLKGHPCAPILCP
jgi:hypothetical protein